MEAKNAVGADLEEVEGGASLPHATNVAKLPLGTVEEPATQDRLRGRPTILAAMPFHPSFDDVFFVAIRQAAQVVGMRAVRVDDLQHAGDAVVETSRQIEQCEILIADLSGGVPDVLYEVGRAHGVGKPTIQICSTPYQDLPFMVRNRETIFYVLGQTHLLAKDLTVYLKRFLGT